MATYIRLGSFGRAPRGGLLQNLARIGVMAIAAVIGVLVLFFAASALLFIGSILVIGGLCVFAFLWARARLSGQTLRQKAFQDMEGKFGLHPDLGRAAQTDMRREDEGNVIDAHKTAHGWSVEP